MTRRPFLDLFSPLPPAPTGVAEFTAGLLEPLRERARLRVWTAQRGPLDLGIPELEIRRFAPEHLDPAELNAADATFYNIGDNPDVHLAIHRMTRRVPGILILHDTNLQRLFSAYAQQPGADRAYDLDQLDAQARELGSAFDEGRAGLEVLIRTAPMTVSVLDGALGAIVHDRAEIDALAPRTHAPIYYLPRAFRCGSAPQRTLPDRNAPSRLVMFRSAASGRLAPILEALASMPDRDRYRLDIYGQLEQEARLRGSIAQLGLGELVTLHGAVPLPDLESALAEADLALNLHWPGMADASSIQLRVWAAGLASLVTPVGWYAQLPPGTAFPIDVQAEREQIVTHLRALRTHPERYLDVGAAGRRVLEREHSPESYADAMLEIAAAHEVQSTRLLGAGLAKRAGRAMLEVSPPELASDLAASVAKHVADLLGRA